MAGVNSFGKPAYSVRMASLYVVRGRDQGKHFQLAESVVRIGRDTHNSVQLLDGETSRHHAEIRVDGESSFTLIDLDSSNGTRINGERISRKELASGDRIEIGSTLLIFTGTAQPKALEAAHGVDIVQQTTDELASRIISSLPRSVRHSNPDPSGLSDDQEQIPITHETAMREGGEDAGSDERPNRLSDSDSSLELMYLTALAVGRTDDLDQLLDRILTLVFDWVDADRGCIMLRDAETRELRPAARCDRQRQSDFVDATEFDSSENPISISSTMLDYVFEQAEGVRTTDAKDDSRFDAAASIVQAGVREAICVPLQGRYDIVGAIYVDTYSSPGQIIERGTPHRFTDDHLRLITAIGYQAALAIEDTFYYGALLQSERLAAMGQTIATLSHHVKNILQGIRGGSYLIDSGLKREDTDAVRRGWSIVEKNQERISNLVLDMLTFSKERQPERIEADWNETAEDVFELMISRASEAGVELVFQPQVEMPSASFDPDAMHQAILNLVTNAIDAAETGEGQASESGSHAKVMIRTAFDATAGWMLDVADNGPGILPEDRQRVFSLFESGKGARGTGLGLPVSAKIVNEHGGRLTIVDVDQPGCCFRICLPIENQDAQGE
ncbi:MAG: ATP-binding protein [Planctomycetota bacterium]